ncbi:Ger(x)C family spore germination protein [Bacillus sp. JJ664]
MNRRLSIAFLFPLLLFFLTGCWDQKEIKDEILINGISFDLNKERKIIINALVLDIVGKGIGVYELKNKYAESIKSSVYESGIELQSSIPGDIETSKTRILLFGEEFAKEDFISLLDTLNRGKIANINVKVAVTNQMPGKEILTMHNNSKPLSFFLSETIENAEDFSLVPKIDLMDIFTLGNEHGIDFSLPLLDKNKDKVVVIGTGLFHAGKYTGRFIPYENTPLLLLMMDKFGKTGLFSTTIQEKKELEKPHNIISYEVFRQSRKFNIHTSGKNVKVDILLKPKIVITEITNKKNISKKQLETIIQADLNKRANTIIKDLKLANSDVLGVGRYLKEHKPDIWKKVNWEKEYPLISFQTKVKVKIISTGSLGELTKSVK